jgi:nucleoside-diphosphate-sugar epimerase
MAAAAGDLFGYKGSVVLGQTTDQDYLVDNPNRRCPDISRARKQLGYEPIVPLDEGLRRLLIWYSANSEAEDA